MLPGAEELAATLTDALFRQPVHELAERRPGRTFVYEFAWRSPFPGIGAAHGLDIGFVFDTLGHGTPREVGPAAEAKGQYRQPDAERARALLESLSAADVTT
jgi:carboxylesterase type B